ncbi:hypothetical protein QR680_017306 [Steinernema hermaphroditum]|uniref:CX domain-containing protein n=1 Tax=Steinernema hermaphroditum TaxID=289476 RepID=A0AA39HE30_9BILA|nr:hypothetical protein QR680_017306 [Steinernema hermaphroditum]
MVGLQKAEATELKCCEGFNDNYGTCSGGMCSTVQMIMNIGNKQKDQVKRQCVEEIGIPPGCIEDRPNERTVIKTCYCNTELCNAVGHGDLSTEGIVEGEHPCSAKSEFSETKLTNLFASRGIPRLAPLRFSLGPFGRPPDETEALRAESRLETPLFKCGLWTTPRRRKQLLAPLNPFLVASSSPPPLPANCVIRRDRIRRDFSFSEAMDLRLQGQSNGIFYTGYSNEFIECVFEDGDISGRNERYEFRCNADLVCCGRQCCVPQEATIPFWLVIILIVLALLLLLAILGALAWMFAKQKPKPQKPKKTYHGPSGGYRSVRQIDDDRHVLGGASDYSSRADNYSSLTRQPMTGYGNGAYNAYDKAADYDVGPSANTVRAHGISSQDQTLSDDHTRREDELTAFQGRQYSQSTVEGEFSPAPPPMTAQRGFFAPPPARHDVHETFEESFKEEIQMERSDSREFL